MKNIAYLQSGLPMDIINTPMSSVTCPNVENPENHAFQFWAFRVKTIRGYPPIKFGHFHPKCPNLTGG